MAEKRIRDEVTNVTTENVITPETKIEQPNQYDSILQRLQEQDAIIKNLTKKVAEANGDISEQAKESKRKYGFNIDGTRNKDELFKFKYSTIFDENKEKVVISTETIGRPINSRNENTGKWFNKHDIKVNFQDGTSATMDILDYINQKVLSEEFIPDEDIKVIDGKKNYTFHTAKFGEFTIAENFIN